MTFALFLFLLLAVTGVIWLIDKLWLASHRAADAKEPMLVEYSKSFFPVILVVFLLRSFLVEPFKIPSGSMLPTLLIGDFVFVNKFIYGIRLPVIDRKIINVKSPERGDVMVFRYPVDPSIDYIKRVVGLPGDVVVYRNKHLTINGQEVLLTPDGQYSYAKSGFNYVTTDRYYETLGKHRFHVLHQPGDPAVRVDAVTAFSYRQNCDYNNEGFRCTVPAGHYFTMGDNRDDSSDSRYWGFVPDANLVGKAFVIWWNFDHLKRVGHAVD